MITHMAMMIHEHKDHSTEYNSKANCVNQITKEDKDGKGNSTRENDIDRTMPVKTGIQAICWLTDNWTISISDYLRKLTLDGY